MYHIGAENFLSTKGLFRENSVYNMRCGLMPIRLSKAIRRGKYRLDYQVFFYDSADFDLGGESMTGFTWLINIHTGKIASSANRISNNMNLDVSELDDGVYAIIFYNVLWTLNQSFVFVS
jgi:hypothetical protein